jgi:hypothetical protein
LRWGENARAPNRHAPAQWPGGSEGGHVMRVNILLQAYYASLMFNALKDLLWPKQCWHIVRVPNYGMY